MSDNNRQINPLLLIIVILLCLFSGFFLRQSSYDPDYFTKESVASTKADNASSAKDSKDKTSTQNSDKKKTSGSTPSATPEPTQKPTETPVVSDDNDVSTEAAKGTWTANGSSWMFLVDGQPYTGWLTDTDHKKYYFNQDGIMQTGWIEVDKKRYYMDQDGIMQTGTVTVGGKTYELQADGSLKN